MAHSDAVTAAVWYGPAPVNGRNRRRFAAVLVVLALAVAAPTGGSADTVDGLRDRAAALARTERGALLRLYAAESAAARARSEVERLDSERTRLAAEIERTRRYREIIRGSLAASHDRIADALRALYVDGPPADAIAVILGATSFENAIDAVESLGFAVEQNRRLAREADARAARLATVTARLGRKAAVLRGAHAAAGTAAERLELIASDRARVVTTIRRDAGVTASRLARLQSLALAAERRSSRLTAGASASFGAAPATLASRSAATPAAGEVPADTVELSTTGGMLTVQAVAYSLPGRTASGLPVGHGIMAVDPSVIPLGTRVFVPGYGEAVAADTGSAVRGNMIDLWVPSLAEARAWGSRTVTITIYRS